MWIGEREKERERATERERRGRKRREREGEGGSTFEMETFIFFFCWSANVLHGENKRDRNKANQGEQESLQSSVLLEAHFTQYLVHLSTSDHS